MTDIAPASKRPAGLIFIFITVLLDVVGIGLIIPILPKLVAQFVNGDLSHAARYFGAIASTYTVMQFGFAPMLGGLSDRFGRKPILLFSMVAASLSYVVMGFAPNLAWLFASRMLAGAAGGSITVATTYIADISTPETRGQNFGLIGAAFGLGFIIGPAIGGLLGSVGLHIPFFVAAAVSALNALYGWLMVPESHLPENRRPFTWDKANPIAGLLNLRNYPGVAGFALTLFFMGMAQSSLQTTWVLYTSYRFDWTVGQVGLSLAIVGVCAAVVQGVLIRRIMAWLGERGTVTVSLLVAIVTYVLYGLATQGWMMYAILPLGSLGGLAGPAVQGLVSKVVSPFEQGRVQGALTGVMSLTGILAPLMANALFAHFANPHTVPHVPGATFYFGAGLFLLALLTAHWVFGRTPETAQAVWSPAGME